MMSAPQFENVSVGYVLVYDSTTGDVLWTHERIVEVPRDREEGPTQITEEECERVRAEAAEVFRGRDVRALIAYEGFALRDNTRIVIDPESKALREIADEPGNLADRLNLTPEPPTSST
jgi:hypothetical protein